MKEYTPVIWYCTRGELQVEEILKGLKVKPKVKSDMEDLVTYLRQPDEGKEVIYDKNGNKTKGEFILVGGDRSSLHELRVLNAYSEVYVLGENLRHPYALASKDERDVLTYYGFI